MEKLKILVLTALFTGLIVSNTEACASSSSQVSNYASENISPARLLQAVYDQVENVDNFINYIIARLNGLGITPNLSELVEIKNQTDNAIKTCNDSFFNRSISNPLSNRFHTIQHVEFSLYKRVYTFQGILRENGLINRSETIPMHIDLNGCRGPIEAADKIRARREEIMRRIERLTESQLSGTNIESHHPEGQDPEVKRFPQIMHNVREFISKILTILVTTTGKPVEMLDPSNQLDVVQNMCQQTMYDIDQGTSDNQIRQFEDQIIMALEVLVQLIHGNGIPSTQALKCLEERDSFSDNQVYIAELMAAIDKDVSGFCG